MSEGNDNGQKQNQRNSTVSSELKPLLERRKQLFAIDDAKITFEKVKNLRVGNLKNHLNTPTFLQMRDALRNCISFIDSL